MSGCGELRLLFLALAALCFCAAVPGAAADEHDHRYTKGEEVTLWVNKVGPYHNPQETYSYYALPFCRPEGTKPIRHRHEGLGAVLEGNDMRDSGVHLRFLHNVDHQFLCDVELTKRSEQVLRKAVENQYWYQMYLDELPMWGMVGQAGSPKAASDPSSAGDGGAGGGDSGSDKPDEAGTEEEAFIFTHKNLVVAVNGDQIIEVNLTSEGAQLIREGVRLEFRFSVKWVETNRSFEDRFDRYLDFDFFEHQIHWFSVFNSFMMVVFLCGLVVLIMIRTLRKDKARYSAEDDELELDRVIDESGWKQVHGDVFRAPGSLALFAALVGTGVQLLVIIFAVIFLAIFGSLYMGRGALLSTFFAVYSLTCAVAGIVSGRLYKLNGGRQWKSTMMLTASLYPGLAFAVVFLLNFVAIGYQTLASMSFGTILTMGAIWCLVAVPLTVVGTVVGRNMTKKGDGPGHVNSIRRPIPEGHWYTSRPVLVLAGGILPFGSIFIEMYYIFSAVWHYKFYYVYGFMLLVYVILLIVTVCVNIVTTYCLLNAEDWRWQWTSFQAGSSTAVYVVLYSVFYFFNKTRMSGLFQVSFYFGHVLIFSIGLGILCGTVGYLGSAFFVRRIFAFIKND